MTDTVNSNYGNSPDAFVRCLGHVTRHATVLSYTVTSANKITVWEPKRQQVLLFVVSVLLYFTVLRTNLKSFAC